MYVFNCSVFKGFTVLACALFPEYPSLLRGVAEPFRGFHDNGCPVHPVPVHAHGDPRGGPGDLGCPDTGLRPQNQRENRKFPLFFLIKNLFTTGPVFTRSHNVMYFVSFR